MATLPKYLLYAAVALFPFCLSGQGAAFPDFSRVDRFSESELGDLIVNSYISPNWFECGGTEYFSYSAERDGIKRFYVVDPAAGEKRELFDFSEMAQKLTALTGEDHEQAELRIYRLDFDGDSADNFRFSVGGEWFRYDTRSGELSRCEAPEQTPMFRIGGSEPHWKNFSPDSTFYVYVNRHDLYLKSRGNEADSVRLTFDGAPDHSYASGRNADGDGNHSPSGRWLKGTHSFYSLRTDRRGVQEMTLINSLSQPIPQATSYKFPTPGSENIFRYDMVVVDADRKRAVKVNLEKFPDQKVEMPLFANAYRAGKYAFFLRKSRPADTLELCRVDRKGKLKTLISENTAPHYNEQMFKYYIIEDNHDILWWSERSGKGAYYLYDRNGKLKNAVTPPGRMVAGDVVHLDTLARTIIVEGYGGEEGINPHYKLFYRVNLDGSGFTLLTPANGDHSIGVSPSGKFIFDSWSRMDTVKCNAVRDMDGKELVRLESPDLEALLATGWKMPKVCRVKAADGVTDLYGIVYMPFDLDPEAKYPVITNVYPGPQDDQIPQGFTLDDNANQRLAQLGCVVINFAYRGSGPKRGRDFYTFGYGNLRDYPLTDDRAVIRQLAEQYPYIDTTRVGIYGHSGGGFMAATAMLSSPDFYKVGVAASGNHDNNIYTQWWGESFHGVKRVPDGDGYRFECKIPTSVELAPNLNGKLLLIHGDMDINVHPANTLRLADALIKAGKRFDMMILPGKDHGLGDEYYINLIRTYFLENLLNQTTNE